MIKSPTIPVGLALALAITLALYHFQVLAPSAGWQLAGWISLGGLLVMGLCFSVLLTRLADRQFADANQLLATLCGAMRFAGGERAILVRVVVGSGRNHPEYLGLVAANEDVTQLVLVDPSPFVVNRYLRAYVDLTELNGRLHGRLITHDFRYTSAAVPVMLGREVVFRCRSLDVATAIGSAGDWA